MLQLTMRNSFHVVETEAVAEAERGHPHQNLAQCSVAMLPVLSLLKEQAMRHYSNITFITVTDFLEDSKYIANQYVYYFLLTSLCYQSS
jgi:hypothetical protein